MDYYMQRACITVEQVFSNASPACYGAMVAGYLMAAATIHAGHVQAAAENEVAASLRAGFEELSAGAELVADGLTDCEAALQSIGGALDTVAHAVAADNRPLAARIRGIEVALSAVLQQVQHSPKTGGQ